MADPSNNVNSLFMPTPTPLQQALRVCLIIGTLVTNGAMIVALMRRTALQHRHCVPLASMSGANLLVGGLSMPAELLVERQGWTTLGHTGCLLLHSLTCVGQTVVLYTLCVMALDACRYKRGRQQPPLKSSWVVGGIWTLSLANNAVPMFAMNRLPVRMASSVCFLSYNQALNLYMLGVSIGCPLFILVSELAVIAWRAFANGGDVSSCGAAEQRHSANRPVGRQTTRSAHNANEQTRAVDTVPAAISRDSRATIVMREHTSSLSLLASLTGVFVLCVTPYLLTTTTRTATFNTWSVSRTTHGYLTWLVMARSIIDPIIYTLTDPLVRRSVWQLVTIKRRVVNVKVEEIAL